MNICCEKGAYMQILQICPKSFASNTYLLISDDSAFVIDPSVSVDAIIENAKKFNASLKGVLLTHGHFDHIFSIDTLRERLDIPVYIHFEDAPMLTDGKINGSYTLFQREFIHNPADQFLTDNQEISLGNEFIKVLNTPGHSKGSCCFIISTDDSKTAIITGDTLFADSVGRCDLYGGSIQELSISIKRLHALDKNALIYPGHGNITSLREALNNTAYFFDF